MNESDNSSSSSDYDSSSSSDEDRQKPLPKRRRVVIESSDDSEEEIVQPAASKIIPPAGPAIEYIHLSSDEEGGNEESQDEKPCIRTRPNIPEVFEEESRKGEYESDLSTEEESDNSDLSYVMTVVNRTLR